MVKRAHYPVVYQGALRQVSAHVRAMGIDNADLAAGRDHIAHGNVCPAEEIERVTRELETLRKGVRAMNLLAGSLPGAGSKEKS